MNLNHIYGNLSQYHAYQGHENSGFGLGHRGPSDHFQPPTLRLSGRLDRSGVSNNSFDRNMGNKPGSNGDRYLASSPLNSNSNNQLGNQRELNLHDSQVSEGVGK